MAARTETVRARLDALFVGAIRPLGDRGAPSGIAKKPVDRLLRLSREGFEGDAQGDERHHGRPDKAIHHYPFEHCALWRRGNRVSRSARPARRIR
jgi:MOSC domain-containing protein YiiM